MSSVSSEQTSAYLARHGISVRELSRRAGIPRGTLRAILEGRITSAANAMRLIQTSSGEITLRGLAEADRGGAA